MSHFPLKPLYSFNFGTGFIPAFQEHRRLLPLPITATLPATASFAGQSQQWWWRTRPLFRTRSVLFIHIWTLVLDCFPCGCRAEWEVAVLSLNTGGRKFPRLKQKERNAFPSLRPCRQNYYAQNSPPLQLSEADRSGQVLLFTCTGALCGDVRESKDGTENWKCNTCKTTAFQSIIH